MLQKKYFLEHKKKNIPFIYNHLTIFFYIQQNSIIVSQVKPFDQGFWGILAIRIEGEQVENQNNWVGETGFHIKRHLVLGISGLIRGVLNQRFKVKKNQDESQGGMTIITG